MSSLKITLIKAIEILEFNLQEAGLKMPTDCHTAVELALDSMAGLSAERHTYGYSRIGLLPHEERVDKN